MKTLGLVEIGGVSISLVSDLSGNHSTRAKERRRGMQGGGTRSRKGGGARGGGSLRGSTIGNSDSQVEISLLQATSFFFQVLLQFLRIFSFL